MKKRVMKLLCAQAVVLSMVVSLCGCGAAAPNSEEATAEIEASKVATSDTLLSKAGTSATEEVSQKREIDLGDTYPYECPEEGITLYFPEEYSNAKGNVQVNAMDLTGGDGVYLIDCSYLGMSSEDVDALMSKDDYTQEELDHYYGSFVTLFNIVGINKNRGAKEICDVVNEQLRSIDDYDGSEVSEDELELITTVDDCTYFKVIYKIQDNYNNLSAEFQEEYDLLFSYCDSIIENADYYEATGIFPGVVGSKLQFETTDIDGNPISSDELFAQHDITMVNVWATWCGWCVNELPELENINNRLADKNCAIVGLFGDGTDDDTIQQGKELLKESGVTYLNILPFDNWTDSFDMSGGWPTSFLVDSTGTIVAIPIVGAEINKYEDLIQKALDGEVDASYNNERSNSEENTEGVYRIYVVDKESNPVPGAMIQFCTADTCHMGQTDENGIATFEYPEDVYQVHVLKVPSGYKPDDNEYLTLETFSDMTIVLDKE